jgi:putative ABC transport system permease protein
VSLFELFRSAISGITTNLTRAALTLLGVMIGIGSVILLLGVGSGAQATVASQIAGLGTNTMTVTAGGSSSSSSRSMTKYQNLTLATATALEKTDDAPDIKAVVPVVQESETVAYGTTSETGAVIGTTANYFTVTNATVAIGTPFQNADNTNARKVCVIGAELAEELFSTADPIGKSITVGSTPFTVYGVLKSKDSSSGSTSSLNTGVVIPINRMQRSISGYGDLSSITLQAKDSDSVTSAAAEATSVIAAQLGVSTSDADFTVTTQDELMETSSSVSSTLSTMLAAIAAISLVVGGIGVMNIMLVTVTERTREIGIRTALGASRFAISAQFIIEATILSLAGGLLGVGAACLASNFTILGTKPTITGGSVLLAAGVSIAIGIFFGGYPAIRASRLKPVDALRHD